MSGLHGDQRPEDGIHAAVSFVYADEAARLAATGFDANDVYKQAIQQDNNTTWLLIDDDPITWKAQDADLSTLAENAVWVGDASSSPVPQVASTNSILGRLSSAAVSWLTSVQLTTLVELFSSSLKGAVPPSGGGTANFLRADGLWVAPPVSVFGEDHGFTIIKPRVTTTSDEFQTRLQVITPALTGFYEVSWGAVIDQNNTGDKVEVQCSNVTDGNLVACDVPVRIEPKDASNRYPTGAMVDVIEFTGAAKTFEVQWREQDGNTAGIQAAWIRYYRVS